MVRLCILLVSTKSASRRNGEMKPILLHRTSIALITCFREPEMLSVKKKSGTIIVPVQIHNRLYDIILVRQHKVVDRRTAFYDINNGSGPGLTRADG